MGGVLCAKFTGLVIDYVGGVLCAKFTGLAIETTWLESCVLCSQVR